MSSMSKATPHQRLRHWATTTPSKVYLRQPVNRQYQEKTWGQVYDEVLRLASALHALGLKKGDVVGLIGKNTPDYFVADFAISVAGLISAPIYFTAGEDTIRYVLEHSEAKAIFIGKLDDPKAVLAAIPSHLTTISEPQGRSQCQHQMVDLIRNHSPLSDVEEPDPDNIFSLIYTSGTTGNPKGVVITYRNIAFGVTTAIKRLKYTEDDRLFSYLPLAHITERAMVQYGSLYHGCCVSFSESLETFAEDVRNTAPTIFISVPRLWVKFQQGVLAKMPQQKLDRLLRIPIVSYFVKRKIKIALGLGRARLTASGAAPIPPSVLRWFERLGIHVVEGFGMSETSGLASANYPFNSSKLGSVGTPVDGVRIRISEEGEVQVSGDCVCAGYYKDPEKSAETLRDGWLHTGDTGELDAEGNLRITGRMKEIFKTAKGKYVSPLKIESLIAENPYVELTCVMGMGMSQPFAVVVLGRAFTEANGRDETSSQIRQLLNRINLRLEAHERLSHIVVSNDPWSIENGLLTPTMKMKRNSLEKRFAALFAELDGDSRGVLILD